MKIIAVLLIFSSIFLTMPALADQTEPLFGIVTDTEKKTLSIWVESSGCTDKSYFTFTLEDDVLTFKRIKRDACKAMPMRHAITYSLEELGIKPQKLFRLGNPISYSEHL
jgi:hypothetical protein